MIKYLLIFFTVLFTNCIALYKGGKSNHSERGVDNKEIPTTIISGFFDKKLKGEDVQFIKYQHIKTTNIGEVSDKIWELWKQANMKLDEDKLPSQGPLSKDRHFQWVLPQEGGESCLLNFYWGSKGKQPSGGYPVFVYLHGSGDREHEWSNGFAFANKFNDGPCYYFIPQIPNTGAYYRWWQQSKQFAWEKLIRNIMLSDYINPNKIFFYGISEGGYGSQRLASYYADYLAGSGPMAGGEPLENAPVENCRNIAFSLRTGAQDFSFYRNILTQAAKDEFDRQEEGNPGYFVHNIEIIPDRGHFIDYEYTTPWLKKYVRKPYPKVVTWEDFSMDGRYRKGFYNLEVLQSPVKENNNRIYYTEKIENNQIDLTVEQVQYIYLQRGKYNIPLKITKKYVPMHSGKIRVYLNKELVDVEKKISVRINGKEVFNGYVKADINAIVNSCALFSDKMRLFPIAIDLDIP